MKAVSVYNPVHDFSRLFESFFDAPASPLGALMDGVRRMDVPACDVKETDAGYTLEAELPGFDEKNIQVHVDNGNLTIESVKDESEEKKEENAGGYLIRERRRMSFSRSFRLPENADTEQVNAVFKNGILSLEIKKRPEAKRQMIKINAEA
jgi:HSP20 family protein